MIETLREYPATRLGISPPISDLAETARGLREAQYRTATTSPSGDPHRPIVKNPRDATEHFIALVMVRRLPKTL
jgi:hypothetical protein